MPFRAHALAIDGAIPLCRHRIVMIYTVTKMGMMGKWRGDFKKYNPQGGRVLWWMSSDRVDFAALINPALSTV